MTNSVASEYQNKNCSENVQKQFDDSLGENKRCLPENVIRNRYVHVKQGVSNKLMHDSAAVGS